MNDPLLPRLVYFEKPVVALSTMIESLGGPADSCGDVLISVYQDLGSSETIPDFMSFDQSTSTLSINPAKDSQAGDYAMTLSYRLVDHPDHEHIETFNVKIEASSINHPPYLSNVIGFDSYRTLQIGDEFDFPLDIVDPDTDAFEEMWLKITCNPSVDSFSYRNDSIT